MNTIFELRWYKGVDDGTFKLQFRNVTVNGQLGNYGEWQEVPFVLEDEPSTT